MGHYIIELSKTPFAPEERASEFAVEDDYMPPEADYVEEIPEEGRMAVLENFRSSHGFEGSGDEIVISNEAALSELRKAYSGFSELAKSLGKAGFEEFCSVGMERKVAELAGCCADRHGIYVLASRYECIPLSSFLRRWVINREDSQNWYAGAIMYYHVFS